MDDFQEKFAEFMAAHRKTQDHLVRMMERQSDLEAMTEELRVGNADLRASIQELKARDGELERLTKQIAEHNIRLSRIVEVHDCDIDELDARLKRLEERRGNMQ